MKKAVSLLLALCLCLCLGLAAPALAADDVISGSCGRYVIWSFEKATGTLTISGKGRMDLLWEAAREVEPDAIRSVVIDEGVTYISVRAFAGCTNLTKAAVAKSVTEVGPGAFLGTLWLKSQGEFAIVNSILLTYQGDAEQVAIPGGVTSIAASAFAGNEVITSVVIPEGVVSIGMGDSDGLVFSGCSNLKDIKFPSTLRESGRFNFFLTPWLDNQKGEFVMAGSVLVKYQGKGGAVVIADGVTAIADAAFAPDDPDDITNFTSLTIPVSVTHLNGEPFLGVEENDLPQTVIYKGGRDQWAKVEGTEWLAESEIPVQCLGATDPAKVFTDMEKGAFYLDSVAWAVKNGIAMGTTSTTFSPKQDCTHGHILTFLWRAAGSPESSVVTPFAMEGDEYYYGAAKWAYERDMINAGFDPKAKCSRVDAVNYIWQAMGRPYAVYGGRFTDLPANSPYAAAVAWAADKGVTTGATATTFDPGGICNRGQIVTFLHRAYK